MPRDNELTVGRDETKIGIVVPGARRALGPACVVVIYGRELGRRWMLDGPSLVMGRGQDCEVVLDLDNVSRRHCEIRLGDNDSHIVEDLGSTNGTFVNSEEVVHPRELRSGDLVKVGSAIFKYLDGDSIENLFHEEIYRMTIVDGLTQVNNKRYLLEYLEREMSRCQRYGRPLSLMMMDIDHFKHVNDTYGHIAGDHVLREVATTIKARVRKEECLARYGGEEFVLVMPEAELQKVAVYAERLRALVEARDLSFEDKPIRVTISIGVAQMTAQTQDMALFLESADARLYDAKNAGRNRVVM